MRVGSEQVKRSGLLTANHIIDIQAEPERNIAGFRKLQGTALKDRGGQTIYTPPQEPAQIVAMPLLPMIILFSALPVPLM